MTFVIQTTPRRSKSGGTAGTATQVYDYSPPSLSEGSAFLLSFFDFNLRVKLSPLERRVARGKLAMLQDRKFRIR